MSRVKLDNLLTDSLFVSKQLVASSVSSAVATQDRDAVGFLPEAYINFSWADRILCFCDAVTGSQIPSSCLCSFPWLALKASLSFLYYFFFFLRSQVQASTFDKFLQVSSRYSWL